MLEQSNFVKIRVAVPVSHADNIRKVLSAAGAGRQGNYDFCSGSQKQVGRFRPLSEAKPSIGKIGRVETVEEELIEVLCHIDLVKKVVEAVKAAHPYEEPAIDILPRLEI